MYRKWGYTFKRKHADILDVSHWVITAHENLLALRSYKTVKVRQNMYREVVKYAQKEVDKLYKLATKFNDFFFGERDPFPPASIVYEEMKNVIYRGLYLFCMYFVLDLFFGIYIKYKYL